ncbi:hypothetical protein ACFV7Q_10630 [Streptomyces sp. NPDC059851]|uniref:hypothetical protein n=1 Tax=Streptomyces sp. NPDC059851 TaxID=3346971 RepID=UPI00365314A9
MKQGMRILLVEDSDLLAGAVGRELEREYGHVVTPVRDPLGLDGLLERERFDMAVVDLLYEHLNKDFDALRSSGKLGIRGNALLVSGLTAIRTLQNRPSPVPTVVWTSGEANRRLHLLYSYQDLGVRAYCSKSPGTGRLDVLEAAARQAVAGAPYVDPVLNPYLPSRKARSASRILLEDETKRAIWRAVALGARTRQEIGTLAGYAPRTVGRLIPEMYQDLTEFDIGLPESRTPFVDLVRYAAGNWQFFLDEAVRAAYP